ncbi:hypothetical protein KY345_06735 [Candidatus Woesearchaeota archaeon]|nr:hypothetical protein [Candidatus Woesearchaeota archaeon]
MSKKLLTAVGVLYLAANTSEATSLKDLARKYIPPDSVKSSVSLKDSAEKHPYKESTKSSTSLRDLAKQLHPEEYAEEHKPEETLEEKSAEPEPKKSYEFSYKSKREKKSYRSGKSGYDLLERVRKSLRALPSSSRRCNGKINPAFVDHYKLNRKLIRQINPRYRSEELKSAEIAFGISGTAQQQMIFHEYFGRYYKPIAREHGKCFAQGMVDLFSLGVISGVNYKFLEYSGIGENLKNEFVDQISNMRIGELQNPSAFKSVLKDEIDKQYIHFEKLLARKR